MFLKPPPLEFKIIDIENEKGILLAIVEEKDGESRIIAFNKIPFKHEELKDQQRTFCAEYLIRSLLIVGASRLSGNSTEKVSSEDLMSHLLEKMK